MSDTASQQLVVFSLGSEEYALPIGVIGLRGKIIPIFDLAGRMGLEAVSTGGRDTDLTYELEMAA
jgi:purine-binding chemotaxis protein CheW